MDQRPTNSGFDAKSTSKEVLGGIRLDGKFAIVTGGYSGIGTETVRALSDAGATVLVPARRRETAEKELAGIARVEIDEMDLSDLATDPKTSVRAFSDRVVKRGREIDFLINNAGVMACPETRVGPKKWEAQFATNHLGHFALTNRVWPVIAKNKGARVISLSSRGHKFSPVRFDDLQFEHGYDKWKAYGQAKTSNVLFAVELDRLGKSFGVRAIAVHPGGIMTNLVRHLEDAELRKLRVYDDQGNLATRFKSIEAGAATTLWAATSPKLANIGGVYCEDCDVAPMSDDEKEMTGVMAHAIDPEQAKRLWKVSAELTGVDAFALK